LAVVCGALSPLNGHLIKFLVKHGTAVRKVETLVFSAALIITVSNALAFADDFQCIALSAEFAISDQDFLLLSVFVSESLCPDFTNYQFVGELLVVEV